MSLLIFQIHHCATTTFLDRCTLYMMCFFTLEILGLSFEEQGLETQGSNGLQWICSMDLFRSWVICFVPKALNIVSNYISNYRLIEV